MRAEPELPAELPPPVIAPKRASPRRPLPRASTELADADVTPPPTQRADASRLSGETKGGFDELAFLSSVVNTAAGPMDAAPADRPDERARRDSFAQRAPDEGIVNLSSDPDLNQGRRGAGSPLAMNVSGNIPIVIKDKSSEAAKSLKCSECGAMNYPTEWYCERCGAELRVALRSPGQRTKAPVGIDADRRFPRSRLCSGRGDGLGEMALLTRRGFLCTSPLRAARSSSVTAAARSSAVAVGALAFLSAVRSAERCARLRTVAARVFRMFFFADAIFGTKRSPDNSVELAIVANPRTYRRTRAKSS